MPEAAPHIDLTDLDRWHNGFPHHDFTWLRAHAKRLEKAAEELEE